MEIELRRHVGNGGGSPQYEVKVQRRVNRDAAPNGDEKVTHSLKKGRTG